MLAAGPNDRSPTHTLREKLHHLSGTRESNGHGLGTYSMVTPSPYYVCATTPPLISFDSMPVVNPHRGHGAENGRSEPSARDLAQVLDQSGEAVIVKDLNAVVTYWNPKQDGRSLLRIATPVQNDEVSTKQGPAPSKVPGN
jgi:hypothetical protein